MMVGLTQVQQLIWNFSKDWEKNRHRYEEVSKATNMPAEFIKITLAGKFGRLWNLPPPRRPLRKTSRQRPQ